MPEVNGAHPMAEADDRYVDEYHTPLIELCATQAVDPDEIRRHMLAGRLPLPSYLRSDETEVVYQDYLRLPKQAGDIDRLCDWFLAQSWSSTTEADSEWNAYLSGRYVCLKPVTPGTRHQAPGTRHQAAQVATCRGDSGRSSYSGARIGALVHPPARARRRARAAVHRLRRTALQRSDLPHDLHRPGPPPLSQDLRPSHNSRRFLATLLDNRAALVGGMPPTRAATNKIRNL